MRTALVTRKTAYEQRHIANWCQVMAIPAVRDDLLRRTRIELRKERYQKELAEIQRKEKESFQTLVSGIKFRDKRHR